MLNFGSLNSGPINDEGTGGAVRFAAVGSCGVSSASATITKITRFETLRALCSASTNTVAWNRILTFSATAQCGVAYAYVDPEKGPLITVGAWCHTGVSSTAVALSGNCIDSTDVTVVGATGVVTLTRHVPFNIAGSATCFVDDISQLNAYVPLAGIANAGAVTLAAVTKTVGLLAACTATATDAVKAIMSYIDSALAAASATGVVQLSGAVPLAISTTAGATTADIFTAGFLVTPQFDTCFATATATVDLFININSNVPSDRIVYVNYSPREIIFPYDNRTVYIYG